MISESVVLSLRVAGAVACVVSLVLNVGSMIWLHVQRKRARFAERLEQVIK
jgi:hypothetical protein